MQLQFVKSRAGELTGKYILDIGCATGELAFQLAQTSAFVTGIDLNDELLNQAKSNKIHPNLHFQTGNMLELKTDFQPMSFDVVLCFGNTLVHLQTIELIQQMLKGVFAVLKPGGKFLLQILNYDYILAKQISELPHIETEIIRFLRKYKFGENNPLIQFQTELVLKKEEKTISNETQLLAIKSAKLIELLQNTKFKNIELFSGFKLEPFGGSHLPLVISAEK